MENFNIKRFGQVFCRLLLVRKKTYFNLFLTAVLFFALAVIASFHPFYWDKLSARGNDSFSRWLIFVLLWCHCDSSYALRFSHYQRFEKQTRQNQ